MPKVQDKRPYSLQKRPANKKEAQKKKEGKNFKYIFYAQFRDENDKYLTAISTGQTSQSAARNWADNALKDGSFNKKNRVTFEVFSKDWWVPETCYYCKEKERTGRPLSLGHIRNSKRNLKNNILPFFKDLEIGKIKYQHIRDWMNSLYDSGMNPATINRNLATLKPMMKEAARIGTIPMDPTAGIPTFAEKPKQKSILTIEELRKLFDSSQILEIWQNSILHYALNILSASTGMRQGECLGLQLQCTNLKERYIEVRHSFSPVQGLKDTKNHEVRIVPLAQRALWALSELIDENHITEPEQLIFDRPEQNIPPDSKQIGNHFYYALSQIGIHEDERKKRNVTFHSYRHLFNTLCRSNAVPDAKIRQVIGHKTAAMTDTYSHFKAEDLQEVIEVQNQIF